MDHNPQLQSTAIISPAASSSAPPGDPTQARPPGRWRRTVFLLRAIEIRLRFVALLVGIGLLVFHWDRLENYWDRWTRPERAAATAAGSHTEFYCPMHPNVVRDREANCPICGMPLSERKKGQSAPLAEGITGRVQLSPHRIRLAGIATVPAEYRPLVKEIRTVGYVDYDESRQSRIVSRVGGYLEKLFIDKTFIEVDEGQPLAEIYSPELFSSARELVLAQQRGSKELVASARTRLRLLGVGDKEIDELLAAGGAEPRLVIRASQSGHVIAKHVVAGSSVAAGDTLFEVADLSVVWIEADVYENDIALIEEGQEIEAAVESYPGRAFAGTVALVHPHVEAATRTNRIRISVHNPDHILRPGMFAEVRILVPLAQSETMRASLASRAPGNGSVEEVPEGVLAVPEGAVIDTGSKQIVYVERQPGVFEGVEVRLGLRSGGYYPVLSGLEAGDLVAAAGGFLIDAETRLNPSAAAAYFGASGGPQGSSPAEGNEQRPKKPSEKDRKNIAALAPADATLALAQGHCPITSEPLGSMGVPVRIELSGRAVFLCCNGCTEEARGAADTTLKKLDQNRTADNGQAP